ncbi:MAG: ABC transporter permease subunit [Deltaproteobacteria bacterium]|nr:ABC transporter permease subunit [Deltaproteobacteria bacterium]MBW1956353.1 ABC transporter permease subunit [Deltaproteobacteria bacterium]MBW2042929.1 ABC transporter permease subunit [Deltaproteobacteria bacterium]MBW2131224.1 ABC transporter permease subunit [Deltaproteobacteria bacterium]
MKGLRVIILKELSDHFSSYRFLILFALITMVSLITVYMVGLNIRNELAGIAKPRFVFLMLFTSPGALFSLVQFVAFFGPLVGLMLGFDAINRERNQGTLSKLLSQPIHRDVVVNGKFLAGVILITVMMASILLFIAGLGLLVVGIVPGSEEVLRMMIYLLVSIIYIAFWLGVAMLFSILFRSTATSALAALAVWIFFSFFITLGASVLANALADRGGAETAESLIKKAGIVKAVTLLSPMELYTDATATVIDPRRKSARSVIALGPMEQISMSRFSGPLALSQSILVVAPHLIFLVALTLICFAVSYTVFMKQEIRSI